MSKIPEETNLRVALRKYMERYFDESPGFTGLSVLVKTSEVMRDVFYRWLREEPEPIPSWPEFTFVVETPDSLLSDAIKQWVRTKQTMGLNEKTIIEKYLELYSITRAGRPISKHISEPTAVVDALENSLLVTMSMPAELFHSIREEAKKEEEDQEDAAEGN